MLDFNMEEFDQDKDIDLSPFPKGHPPSHNSNTLKFGETIFSLVKDHMSQFSSEGHKRNIISCYRDKDSTFIRTFECSDDNSRHFRITSQLRNLFFPIWILLALIPEEEERSFTIEKLVVTQLYKEISVIDQLRPLIGKGSLIIKKLTVVCLSNTLPNITNLMEQLKSLGNVTFEHVKLKVVIERTFNYSNFLAELHAASEGYDDLKLMRDYKPGGRKITVDAEIPGQLEEDDLAAEVPLLKGIRDSPHKMLGQHIGLDAMHYYKLVNFNRILIAILGYGCYRSNQTKPPLNIVDMKNFTNRTAPVYHDTAALYYHTGLKNDDTNKSTFVICQTTYCDGTIANGATSKAIQWLREKWQEETWKKDYDNLLVLIPYGGQYMEDEMIQIHKATDEGIIIVCAAGDKGGDVVFPAALGTVLSVGVADNGPKGREVDIHARVLDPDCGSAATIITCLLANLLTRINHVLTRESKLPDRLHQALAEAIKDTPGYLHTCVIRELLVNEGSGSHDPQLGYGDGLKILKNFSSVVNGVLLEKLANVLLIEDVSHSNKSTKSNDVTIKSIEKIDDEKRKKLFHKLDGSAISVTVLDQDIVKEEQIGTSFTLFTATGRYEQHGEECASVLHTICPNASILCANNREELYHLAFTDCTNHESSIDVISYSRSIPSFFNDMCRVVNEAVVAGKIIVFAAGNTGKKARNTVEYPGRIGNILVVGGRDAHHNRIGFSAIGREMDFLAEGEIGTYTGTSFAAPVVAGYIALLLQFIKENMNTDQDKIRAWSKNEEGAYEWRDIPAFDAAHNVYAMRTLLKLLVPKPQDHTEAEGFGCLDFSTLFPCYRIKDSHELVTGSAKRRIHETLQKFYKHK